MRRLTIALLLFCAGCALDAMPVESAQTSEANEYWYLKQERIDAYRLQDRRAMERLLSPHFIAMSVGGEHLSREEYLQAEFPRERSSGPETETDVTDFNATRVGSTLVLNYRETERTNVAGQVFNTRLSRLDVYVREHERWLLLTMSAVRLPQAPHVLELSPAQLVEYVGVYQYGPGATSTVRLVGKRLMERSTGNPEVEMLPVGPDEFYSEPDLEARALFERDDNGRVVAQVYRSGTQALRAPRVE